MTPAPKPTLTDRFMTFLFGKRVEGEALEPAQVVQPPRLVRWALSLTFLVWFGILLFWILGALGWLPMPREAFTLNWLLGINAIGLAHRLLGDAVRKHYARRFQQASGAADIRPAAQ